MTPIENVRKIIESRHIDQVLLLFADLQGDMRAKYAVPEELIREDHISWADGISVDGSQIPCFNGIEGSEWMRIRPDLSRPILMDWASGDSGNRTIGFLCKIAGYKYDPRGRAYDLQEKAQDLGFVPYAGSKLHIKMGKSNNAVGSYAPVHMDATLNFRNLLVRKLVNIGIQIEYHYGENGNIMNIDFVPKPFALAADNVSITKVVAYKLAESLGTEISFERQTMYTHFSLWKDGKNCFFNPSDRYELSEIGRKFIKGVLLERTRIHGVANPAGVLKEYLPRWSIKRDNSIIQVPMYFEEKKKRDRVGWSKRFIFRDLCADSNPYIAFSYIAMAGLSRVLDKDLTTLIEDMAEMYRLTKLKARKRISGKSK